MHTLFIVVFAFAALVGILWLAVSMLHEKHSVHRWTTKDRYDNDIHYGYRIIYPKEGIMTKAHVVLLPGLFGWSGWYDDLAVKIASQGFVVHGFNIYPAGFRRRRFFRLKIIRDPTYRDATVQLLNPETQAEHVLQYIAALHDGRGKAVIVGFGLGGAIGHMAAAMGPDRIQALYAWYPHVRFPFECGHQPIDDVQSLPVHSIVFFGKRDNVVGEKAIGQYYQLAKDSPTVQVSLLDTGRTFAQPTIGGPPFLSPFFRPRASRETLEVAVNNLNSHFRT